MKVLCLLLSIALSCSAAGDLHDHLPASMTMGAAQSPERVPPPGEQHEASWRQEVMDLIKQLVQIQTEVAKSQSQVVQLLGTLGIQGSQQIQDLQNLARHQSLLVENHQALLLQMSRISTQLQEAFKKPAPPITAPSL